MLVIVSLDKLSIFFMFFGAHRATEVLKWFLSRLCVKRFFLDFFEFICKNKLFLRSFTWSEKSFTLEPRKVNEEKSFQFWLKVINVWGISTRLLNSGLSQVVHDSTERIVAKTTNVVNDSCGLALSWIFNEIPVTSLWLSNVITPNNVLQALKTNLMAKEIMRWDTLMEASFLLVQR